MNTARDGFGLAAHQSEVVGAETMPRRLLSDVQEMVAEQVRYRGLLAELVRRDLLLRYKQTIMGFGWAVFMPLLNTVVFSVIFTKVAPLDVGIPYPLFAYCGLLFWNFFAASLRFSAVSLSGNPVLVTKVYFPREVLPLSSVLVALVDCGVGSAVLFALMAWYGFVPPLSILALPLVVAVHVALTLAVGLLLAMMNLFFRDVKYLLEVVISVWMFATSVLYPLDRLEGAWAAGLRLNPMIPIIDAYRDVIIFGRSPLNLHFVVAAIGSCLLLGSVWLVFHRSEPRFAERV